MRTSTFRGLGDAEDDEFELPRLGGGGGSGRPLALQRSMKFMNLNIYAEKARQRSLELQKRILAHNILVLNKFKF